MIYLAALTPFNDSAVGNTMLVGNFLPVGVLLFLAVLLLVINAPLRRLRPAWAFSSGELVVVLGMMLVSCAIPGSGLMRYLFPPLMGYYQQAGASAPHAETFAAVQFPDWLLPEFSESDSRDVVRRSGDPVVAYFNGRVPGTDKGFAGALGAVPWQAWVRPTITWGLLVAFLFGATLFGSIIVRRQWVENERLAFPLAGVWTSLIEEPKPGRLLNPTLASRAFWIAAAAVFAMHSWNAMFRYAPQEFPQLPLGYNFGGSLFAQPPLAWADTFFKQADIYFAMIGIAFFLQSKVGFSLWFFYLLLNAIRISARSYGTTITGPMEYDQTMGAAAAFVLVILWIGRRHWALVIRQMVRGRQEGEPAGRYLPYAFAGWGLVACIIGEIIVLMVVGVGLWPATALTLGTLLLFLVMARVVAETGLIFAQVRSSVERLFVYQAGTPFGRVGETDFFWGKHFMTLFHHDMRENLAVYATHALRVADESAFKNEHSPSAWRRTAPFIGALVLSLVVSYGVSAASTLTVHYNFNARLDTQALSPLDPHAQANNPRNTLDLVRKHERPDGWTDGHSRPAYFSFGAIFTGVLAFLRLRFDAWPLHPIGFLLVYTYPIRKIWFSLMLGWIAKVLIVKFGGPPLMRGARPFFLGLIIGEAAAAATWLTVSLILVSMGRPYEAINLLPG